MIFTGVIEAIQDTVEKNRDPRTAEWVTTNTVSSVVTIVISYLVFVLFVGPRLMEKRRPYKLTTILIIYNLLQVVLNIWRFIEGFKAGWWGQYNIFCQPVDYSDTPEAMKMAICTWWYYLLKVIDLLDTVFFIMRKKFNQVTFLHVYHHTFMIALGWCAVNFYPGGHGSFLGMVNTFVHSVMYSYYLLAALGPSFQKLLWWKKHVTRIQMLQFVLVFLHSVQIFWNGCDYPKWIAATLSAQAGVFFMLFMNFYIRAYKSKQA